jgi:hypothetical protein
LHIILASSSFNTIITKRTRDKSEELLCNQDAEHRPHCPRDHRCQDQVRQVPEDCRDKVQERAQPQCRGQQVQTNCYTGVYLRDKTEQVRTDTHHPPEHPHNQMSSNTDLKCTVKKPRPALETDKDIDVLTTTTSHQIMFWMMEIEMTTMEGRKSEKSKEHEEINVTDTDRTMENGKEEIKKKLMITRHQECNIDEGETAVKRPGSTFEAHETPHTLTTSPPETTLQPPENVEPSPIILSARSLNPTKLKLISAQDQEDLTTTLAPQRMEKVHRVESSDHEHGVGKGPPYKLEMDMGSAKKRKHEVLAENEEINELPTARDTITDNSSHRDSTLDDNDGYEPRGQQTSLDDVPQLISQVQTCHQTGEEEEAKPASCPHKMCLEAGHFSQITTQPPEAPEAPNKKENRSLKGQNETNRNTSDDKNKGVNLPKEKMNVGRNYGEKSVPNENRLSEEDDKSKDHDMRRSDYKPSEELNDGVDDAKKHDEERTQPISPSTPTSHDHYSSHSNSVCSYPATSSMEITCSSTGRNLDHVYANTPRGNAATLWDKDSHPGEKLVTKMDLLQQQAVMDKTQIQEEIFEMKNRIKWLEDRAMKQQVGPTELNEETLSTPTSSQGHQRVFLLETATVLNSPISTQSPVNTLSGRYGPDQDKNNCAQQVPMCQMTVNMFLLLMRTHK